MTTKNVGQPCVICGQPANAQATVEALQRERGAIEKVLDIDSGKTTLEKVTDLKYSFAQVWASYQDAANEMFKTQAALDAEREKVKTLRDERDRLREALKALVSEVGSYTVERHYYSREQASKDLDRREKALLAQLQHAKAALTPAGEDGGATK